MTLSKEFEKLLLDSNFKNNKNQLSPEYECAGYGDNQGTPYLIGIDNKFNLVTVLLRDVTLIPIPSAP